MKSYAPVVLIIICILGSACIRRASKKPEPIAKVSILLLDYRGEPLADHPVRIERARTGRNWDVDRVADGRTDAQGRIEFTEVQSEDRVRATSDDDRLWLSLKLKAGTYDYTARMDEFGVGLATTGSAGSPEHTWDEFTAASATLEKIVASYVKTGSESFASLEHYVNTGVVSRRAADKVLSLRPYMGTAEDSVNFHWGDLRAVVKTYREPLGWQPH